LRTTRSNIEKTGLMFSLNMLRRILSLRVTSVRQRLAFEPQSSNSL
jgi:hypothetical protein